MVKKKGILINKMPRYKKDLKGAYTNENKAQREQANQALDSFEDIIAKPPEFLNKGAKYVFLQIIESSKKGNLKEIDLPLLATYSEVYSSLVDATQHLNEEGLVVDGKTNPYFRIFNQLTTQLKKLASELGITPNSRAKIEINNARNHEDDKSDPFVEVVNNG